MRGDPVTRGFESLGDPHILVRTDVIEKARQGRESTWAPSDPTMQSDRQHLRRVERARIALIVEHVESVAQIVEVLLTGGKARGTRKTHVVGVERVGHDQLRL